jgi:hypothetical protein
VSTRKPKAIELLRQATGAGSAPALFAAELTEESSVNDQIKKEEARLARIENDIREKDQTLKEQTLRLLFAFLAAETVVVFGIALLQGFRILGFKLDEWSLRLLLAATIVQTVSMLTIAIKHLFPQKKQ